MMVSPALRAGSRSWSLNFPCSVLVVAPMEVQVLCRRTGRRGGGT